MLQLFGTLICSLIFVSFINLCLSPMNSSIFVNPFEMIAFQYCFQYSFGTHYIPISSVFFTSYLFSLSHFLVEYWMLTFLGFMTSFIECFPILYFSNSPFLPSFPCCILRNIRKVFFILGFSVVSEFLCNRWLLLYYFEYKLFPELTFIMNELTLIEYLWRYCFFVSVATW